MHILSREIYAGHTLSRDIHVRHIFSLDDIVLVQTKRNRTLDIYSLYVHNRNRKACITNSIVVYIDRYIVLLSIYSLEIYML